MEILKTEEKILKDYIENLVTLMNTRSELDQDFYKSQKQKTKILIEIKKVKRFLEKYEY